MTTSLGRGAGPGAIVLLVLAAWSLGAVTGCQDPRFRAAQAVRDARIVRYAEWVEHREAGRPAHIRWVRETAQNIDAKRAEQLDKTLQGIAERVRHDRQHWRETAEARATWFRTWLAGSPQNIPDTFAAMAY